MNEKSRGFFETIKEALTGSSSCNTAALSDVGCVRDNNEDNFLLRGSINDSSSSHAHANADLKPGEWHCLGLFDGMGGIAGGEIASKETAQVFRASADQFPGKSPSEIQELMRQAFSKANEQINAARSANKVGGTTATIALLRDKTLKLFHVGDSRAYLITRHSIQQLSEDQTLAQMEAKMNVKNIPEEDKHKLTCFVGMDSRYKMTIFETDLLQVKSGNYLLLCSDGLSDLCTNKEIFKIVHAAATPAAGAQALVKQAKQNGGYDNVTVVLHQFH